jgi:hypothetical protein
MASKKKPVAKSLDVVKSLSPPMTDIFADTLSPFT